MRATKNILPVILGLSLAWLSACGGAAYQESATSTPSGTTSGTTTGSTTVTTSSSPTPIVITSGTTSTTFTPSLNYSFTGHGVDTYTTPQIDTDTILKVQVIGGAAIGNIGGATNFTANYTCVRYNIAASIGGSQTTNLLQVAGGGAGCQGSDQNGNPYTNEQIIDFSGQLSPGHLGITLTISSVESNFKYQSCLADLYMGYYNPYGENCAYYYPVAQTYDAIVNGVREAQGWSGSLAVEVNGSSSTN